MNRHEDIPAEAMEASLKLQSIAKLKGWGGMTGCGAWSVNGIGSVIPLRERISDLEKQLEIESMRLAACGVIAMADTVSSRDEARKMHSDYESASAHDVARRVDECIALRAENEQLRRMNMECSRLAAVEASKRHEAEAEIERLKRGVKPPLGIKPERIWKDQRIEELEAAINRYVDSKTPVPWEWVEELGRLVEVKA